MIERAPHTDAESVRYQQEECFRPSAEAAHGIVKALRDASPAEARYLPRRHMNNRFSHHVPGCRDVLVPIRKRVKRNTEQHVAPPFSCAAAYSAMLTEQEHRSVLGKRMWNFYIKHNQERLPVLGPGKTVAGSSHRCPCLVLAIPRLQMSGTVNCDHSTVPSDGINSNTDLIPTPA